MIKARALPVDANPLRLCLSTLSHHPVADYLLRLSLSLYTSNRWGFVIEADLTGAERLA